MTSTQACATAVAVAGLLLSSDVAAQNWPQWRGPSSHGVSAESGLPTTWSASENVAWRTPAGRPRHLVAHRVGRPRVRDLADRPHGRWPVGGAHPQLARDDRALADHETADWRPPRTSERRRRGLARRRSLPTLRRPAALGASHGSDRAACPSVHEKHNLATPTPVTDGQRVYAWFGNGQVVALDMEGRLVWTRHLGVEYSPFQARWGHGSSPALYGDLLDPAVRSPVESRICWRSMRAREASDGRWTAATDRVSHSTPLVVRGPGGDELLVNSSERIDAYDPATGTLLWYPDHRRQTPIPSAVFHDGVIYPQSRLSQQRLHGDQARRARRRHRDARRVAGGVRGVCTCRRSCTTTACST